MQQYLDLVEHVLENGVKKSNRTGIDTLSSFAYNYRVDLSKGFPLLTTKKVYFRSVIIELLWYLRGEDHVRWLRDEQDVHIWDEWADEDGHVGPIYPVLWRNFPYFECEEVNFEGNASNLQKSKWVKKEYDQVQAAIDTLKNNPNSRRIVVSAWHPGLLDKMALPPCHIMYIFHVSDGKLNCHLTQRSGDIALGIPFNLACYAALTMAIANETNFEYGTFSHTIVDAHIYENHIEGLREQLTREPRERPQLEIADKPIDELEYEDFELKNYNPHPHIKFEVAV
jgi:thymidylate synthase